MSIKASEIVPYRIGFKSLKEALKTDEGLYLGWKANIAMSFYDACSNAGYSFPDLHRVSNEAADNFLTLLLKDDPEKELS